MLYSFGKVRETMLRQGMRTSSICNPQHAATPCNRVAKRMQQATQQARLCCDCLAEVCKYWANNVPIC